MSNDIDRAFYDRADAHIHLANSQVDGVGRGKVSASMMYANARFSAWLSATWCQSAEDMQMRREENIAYFVEQFQKMLDENYDDYADNFETYMDNRNG
ncbi:MAG: DUF3144 domain-containing protein [Asticcacaulis sp.]|uniref:DUF3144 domain-containing protein n=1 Tax=Asticcacaulis sp. TaxID=1872648 RepID=UPI0039E45C3A